jgi:glucan phosphoethanolaminetransferase (alkaline phosphatase superfamily)
LWKTDTVVLKGYIKNTMPFKRTIVWLVFNANFSSMSFDWCLKPTLAVCHLISVYANFSSMSFDWCLKPTLEVCHLIGV